MMKFLQTTVKGNNFLELFHSENTSFLFTKKTAKDNSICILSYHEKRLTSRAGQGSFHLREKKGL